MLADKLKMLRESKGLTQQELAEKLSISTAALANYECGIREPRDNAVWRKIAQYFNVSIDYLMDVDTPITLAADTITTVDKPVVLHAPSLKDVDFALYGEIQDLTDEEKQDLENFIAFIKSKRNKN